MRELLHSVFAVPFSARVRKNLKDTELQPEVEDGKPDIGAYEADPEVYVIPGRQMLTRAGIPVPFDGARAVSRDADLMWL